MKFKIITLLLVLVIIGIWSVNHTASKQASLENTIKPGPIVFERPKEAVALEEFLIEEIVLEETEEIIIFEEDQTEPELKEKIVVDDIEEEEDLLIEEINIIDKLVDWGHHSPSGSRIIDTIIIHSCYDALGDDPYSIDGILAEFRIYKVAPHYLIGRDGAVYRLVVDQDIAWHAGVSEMPDSRTSVNKFSLGIELVNLKTNTPTEAQYIALADLVESLKKEYEIKHILGHDQIAPERKTDPWNFDWEKFNNI